MASDIGVPSSVPNHIGIVVKDVGETARLLTAIWGPLGLGPWDFQETTQGKDIVTVGEPFALKLGVASWQALVVLELLQPVSENSLFSQFIKEKGEGIHHIAYGVSNYDDEVAKLKESGGGMIAGGIFKGRRWCYYEIDPSGIVLELMEQKQLA